MKKLFPDEKGSKKGFREFLDKKGFYIVLLLCIAVVAGTAVYVTTRNVTSDKLDDSQNIIPEGTNYAANTGDSINAQATTGISVSAAGNVAPNNAAGTEPNSSGTALTEPQKSGAGAAPAKPSEPAKTTPPKTTTPKATTPKTSSTRTTAPAKQQDFILPVFGDVTFEYARDKVVYSKTLEEWRTHDGIDLSADRGTPVKCVADGIVSEIKNDPRYGTVIVIDHQNGLKTVYANLASDDMVTPNEKVKQGDVIGCVGNTATIESAEQSHLHFEVLKNNDYADPMAYLPESAADVNQP